VARQLTSARIHYDPDDYDSDYHFSSRPLGALQGMNGGAEVIYTGTFSKVLFPALRIGYVVAPPTLVEKFIAQRLTLDRSCRRSISWC
jgi:GntR family transcriptional regulator/MocR family aminotransferase